MINKTQLTNLVIDTLHRGNLYSGSALNLILGTIAQESKMGTYIQQIKGPALGICQMEPSTEEDIWNNYIGYNTSLRELLFSYFGVTGPDIFKLKSDLAYQIIMCRIQYLRFSEKLPQPNDIEGMARYWKKYYNTPLGAGTVEEFIDNYKKYVL